MNDLDTEAARYLMSDLPPGRGRAAALHCAAEVDRLRRVLGHWYARAAESPNLAVTLTAEEIARERDGER